MSFHMNLGATVKLHGVLVFILVCSCDVMLFYRRVLNERVVARVARVTRIGSRFVDVTRGANEFDTSTQVLRMRHTSSRLVDTKRFSSNVRPCRGPKLDTDLTRQAALDTRQSISYTLYGIENNDTENSSKHFHLTHTRAHTACSSGRLRQLSFVHFHGFSIEMMMCVEQPGEQLYNKTVM